MRLVMSTIEASTFDATSSDDSGLLPDVPPGLVGTGADDTNGWETRRWASPTGPPIDAPRAMPPRAAPHGAPPPAPRTRGAPRRAAPPAGGSTGAVGQGGDSGPWSTVAWAFG